MHSRKLIEHIESLADPRRAASWDHSGIQIAGTLAECQRLAVTLDPLPDRLEAALDWGAECILTHHPLTLSPRLPDHLDDYHHVLRLVLGRGAWLYAAHTSLDVRTDGPAGWLADALHLEQRQILEPAGTIPGLQIRFGAPSAAARDRCLTILAQDKRYQVMAVGTELLDVVIRNRSAFPALQAALAAACPELSLVSRLELESPAEPYGYGLVGVLPEPCTVPALRERLWQLLPRTFCVQAGDEPKTVTTLAYCPGSGADMAPRAFAAGADVYITGDLKYHPATAVPRGRLVLDVGHFALEEVMLRVFARELATTLGPNGPQIRFFPGNDPFSVHLPEGAPGPRSDETFGEESCI